MIEDFKFHTISVSHSDLKQTLNEIEAKNGIVQSILPNHYSRHPIDGSLKLFSVLIIYKLPKK